MMSPKSISALNLASKCFSQAVEPVFKSNVSVVSQKSFTSCSKPKRSYYDMYNMPEESIPTSPKTVSNNGAGSVVQDEMTYIDNAQDDNYSIPDTPFMPTVCSDEAVSGQGHRTI